jgi:AcrR family transcriptional regulator
MSRPKSDDKRKAILDATLRIFAERGINAPTSAISRAAGVAEGSLFTYFKTKNELMRELYLELRREFSRRLTDFPHNADARTRLRYIWDKYLELGQAHPEQLKVLSQLRASGKMYQEGEGNLFAISEMLSAAGEATIGNRLRHAPPEFLFLLLRAGAEATIEYMNANPNCDPSCRDFGFDMLWAGLSKI